MTVASPLRESHCKTNLAASFDIPKSEGAVIVLRENTAIGHHKGTSDANAANVGHRIHALISQRRSETFVLDGPGRREAAARHAGFGP
jgi:hypothetical protein